MKKKVAIFLSIITIVICGWLIINRLNLLDIPSNKNDTYASFEKQKINNRTDINECEKDILKNAIDFERENKRQISVISYQTQITAFVIILIQIVLLIIILMIPKKVKGRINPE